MTRNPEHSPVTPTESESILEARYASRLEALEIRKEIIEQLIGWIKYGGSAIAVGLALLGWWFGNSYSEAANNAQKAAASAFEREFFRNTESAKAFAELRQSYEKALANLALIESDLKGYKALRDIVGNVEDFDPLELYSALDQEIESREVKTRQYSRTGTVSIEETTHDPAFRQKAAFVFQKLLGAVHTGAKSGKPKVEVVTLFNAAANASKVDMDFVSLELMEAAIAQDKSQAPENMARLIRQRLTMSRITDAEALGEIRQVLRRTSGFNVHHVLSEAFNIGLRTADPAGVAEMILTELPAELQRTSSAYLNAARLLSMGHSSDHWEKAAALKVAGIQALEQEPTTVRWYRSSMLDLDRLKELP